MRKLLPLAIVVPLTLSTFILLGCHTGPGKPLKRKGDEIIVAGQLFHTGTRIVTWMDPRGYDGYRVERRFSPEEESSWEKTKDAVKDTNSKIEKSTLGDLGALSDLKAKMEGNAQDQ